MKKEDFVRLSLTEKMDHLRMAGEFIGSRQLPSHRVHLFTLGGYYIELFVHVATNQAQWIEIQTNQSILQEYLTDLDWKGDLDGLI